jgi:hypothetical protein
MPLEQTPTKDSTQTAITEDWQSGSSGRAPAQIAIIVCK